MLIGSRSLVYIVMYRDATARRSSGAVKVIRSTGPSTSLQRLMYSHNQQFLIF